MKHCRDCAYWYTVTQWKGNCKIYPWHKDKYSQDTTADGCRDYEDKYIKLKALKEA